jgi:DNA polymerase III subunit epsilon
MGEIRVSISLSRLLGNPWADVAPLRHDGGMPECDWIAIDFETATAARDSACAVGLAYVRDGHVAGLERALIQPPGNLYDGFNCMIHGIEPPMTAGSLTFAETWPILRERFANKPLLAHNASFDVSVIRHCLDSCELSYPEATYFCSRVFSSRHWPGLPSYALDIVADHAGIEFEHHDPAEDARAAAEIALLITRETEAADLHSLANLKAIRPGKLFPGGYRACSCARAHGWHGISAKDIDAQTDEFDDAHPFFGAEIVFTGALESMPRRTAMQLLADVGGRPSDRVTKETVYLVVGQLDFRMLREGEQLSAKMKRAEQLRAEGHPIEILCEADFVQLL